MTNQEAMRIKYYLEILIDYHGRNRAKDGEDAAGMIYRHSVRSDGLGILAEKALDILGDTNWPDAESVRRERNETA